MFFFSARFSVVSVWSCRVYNGNRRAQRSIKAETQMPKREWNIYFILFSMWAVVVQRVFLTLLLLSFYDECCFFFGYSLPFSTNLVFKSKIHSKFSWKCVVSAQRQRHYFWSLANHFRSYLRRLAERECLLIDKSSFWPTCTENLTHTFRWIVILFMFWLLSVERR